MSVWHHTDFKFHRLVTQIGCYWGGSGHTELYLFEGDRLALMDTGVAETPSAYVEPALRAIGWSLADVEVVINTHGHHDHAGGNHAVWQASGCEIWIHSADAPIAGDAAHQFDVFFARNQTLLGRTAELERERAQHAQFAGAPAPIARTFSDGEVLDLGRGIELAVVHTPGHTPGCCTFLWEREGIAFSGDSVLGRGSREGGLPLIFYPDDYRRTLEKVKQLGARILCLGHHYRTLRQTDESIRFGNLIGAYVDESAEIADVVEQATESALRELGESAPFERVARAALVRIGERIPLDGGSGADFPYGAVAAISAYWSRTTGRPV